MFKMPLKIIICNFARDNSSFYKQANCLLLSHQKAMAFRRKLSRQEMFEISLRIIIC